MEKTPTPLELAEEARRALQAAPMSSREHFEFLVQQGIIDRNGRVLVARLFGGEGPGESDGTAPAPAAPPDSGT